MVEAELLGMVAFAVGAGIATFFSPCAYALLPGYVGYYVSATDGEAPPVGGSALRGTAAAAGALGVFAVFTVIAIAASDLLERSLPFLEYGVGVALILLGAWVIYAGPGSVHVMLPERRASVVGFALFGALYAVAATACVLPVFLGLFFRSLTLAPGGSALVIGTYAGSFAVLMLSTTVAIGVGFDVGMGRLGSRADALIRAAGVVLVVAGLAQLYVAYTAAV